MSSEIDHLVGTADQWEHYQDPNGLSSLSARLNCCSDDCLSLRFIDLWIRYGKTAASVTEHWIVLAQLVHLGEETRFSLQG